MAVHRRAYRPYDGPLTSERWRFLVMPRYAFREIFESKVLVTFVVLCLVPFLLEAAAIYVSNSASARALLRMTGAPDRVRPEFFLAAMTIQGVLAFLLAAWVAPALVAPDLASGALPLYLSRPLSRAEYLMGKAAVLVALLSLVTWVPVLTLFVLQSSLAGWGWLAANARVPFAVLVGSLVWVVVLTLLGLAISAWIRWRLAASATLVAVFFLGTGFGEMWDEVLKNPWGRMASLSYLVGVVWRELFLPVTPDLRLHFMKPGMELPAWAAVLGLLATAAGCVWLLDRRLRAREVVS